MVEFLQYIEETGSIATQVKMEVLVRKCNLSH